MSAADWSQCLLVAGLFGVAELALIIVLDLLLSDAVRIAEILRGKS